MRLIMMLMTYNLFRVIIVFITMISIVMMLKKRWFEQKIPFYMIAIILIFMMDMYIMPKGSKGNVTIASAIILVWAMGISTIVHYIILDRQTKKVLESPPVKICFECGKESKLVSLNKGYVFRCVDYPNCNYAESIDGKTRMCPKCGARLKIKKGKPNDYYKCSNTRECDYTEIILNDKNI